MSCFNSISRSQYLLLFCCKSFPNSDVDLQPPIQTWIYYCFKCWFILNKTLKKFASHNLFSLNKWRNSRGIPRVKWFASVNLSLYIFYMTWPVFPFYFKGKKKVCQSPCLSSPLSLFTFLLIPVMHQWVVVSCCSAVLLVLNHWDSAFVPALWQTQKR